MQEVLKIINQLANTPGRNDKEDILKQNKNNELLKEILKFVFDPYIVTGLSSKKINKRIPIVKDFKPQINNINDMMYYLKQNKTGADIDILQVQSFILNHNDNKLIGLLNQIATKSLKIGVTAKTLNKVYGKDFIREFNVMLAEKYFDYEDKLDEEFIVTEKLDGLRCVIIKENSSISVFSRQGQPIEDLIEILEEAEQLPDNMVYDGELILRNDKNLPSKDLYRETIKVARKDGAKKNLIFNCFDVLPTKSFKEGKSHNPCIFRKALLHEMLSKLNLPHIVEVPILYIGKDKDMIIKLLDEQIALEHEGVMVNIANAPYECRRVKSILKVKKFNDADVRVVHVLEGTGKNINKLGAITIQFLHDGKMYECNCGSGFSDEERIKYWERPELILNKIATIGYFEVSQNQNGGVGLRFPTWKGIIRDDKDEISMY